MSGKILTDSDVISAMVHEVSEHGALLSTPLSMAIGYTFEFTFDEERQISYQAVVRSMRKPGLYGVEFVGRTIDPVVVDAWREAFATHP